jgi:hypothetical protein
MNRSIGLTLVFGCCLVLASAGIYAQSPVVANIGEPSAEPPAGVFDPVDECAGGIVLDDGTFENGISALIPDAPMVGRFTFAQPVRVVRVCNGLLAVIEEASMQYEIVFFAADGAGGTEPGTELERVAAPEAVNVPFNPDVGFYTTNLSVELPAGDVYIGIEQLNALGEVFWAVDQNTANDFQFYNSTVPEWETFTELGQWGETSTAAIHLVVEALESRATFEVNKDFTDDNPNGVEVTISCNTGLPLEQSKVITEGEGVEFVVVDFDDGEMDCEVTEEGLAGYDAEYFNGTTTSSTECEYLDVGWSTEFSCRITNTPAPVEVEITKDWVFEGTSTPQGIDQRYELTLWCDAEIVDGEQVGDAQETPSLIVGPFCGLIVLEGVQGSFFADWCKSFSGEGPDSFTAEVIPEFPESHCFVIERLFDDAVEVDNGCQNITVSAGVGASCTITNTVFFEGIPTLNQYGLALLALLMLGVSFVGFRRFV